MIDTIEIVSLSVFVDHGAGGCRDEEDDRFRCAC
jgi:hypothetical protein